MTAIEVEQWYHKWMADRGKSGIATVNVLDMLKDFAQQYANQQPGVFAVTKDFRVKYHPTDLSNVMKPDEVLFIGTGYECACFIRDNQQPVNWYSRGQMEDCFAEGVKAGRTFDELPTPRVIFEQFIERVNLQPVNGGWVRVEDG